MAGYGALGSGDEEEDGFLPADIAAQLRAIQERVAKSQAEQDRVRQQDLQMATERLRQKQYGPTLAERLFGLSAAFAQPSRTKGFAGVMGNVAPVLAQSFGAARQGKDAQAAELEALRAKYLDEGYAAEQRGFANEISALKGAAAASKPVKPRLGIDPLGRGVVNLDTAEIVPFGAAGGGGLPTAKSQAEYDALPPGAEYLAPDGSRRRKGGGQTGSPPSGGFRNIPSGNPLDPYLGD